MRRFGTRNLPAWVSEKASFERSYTAGIWKTETQPGFEDLNWGLN